MAAAQRSSTRPRLESVCVCGAHFLPQELTRLSYAVSTQYNSLRVAPHLTRDTDARALSSLLSSVSRLCLSPRTSSHLAELCAERCVLCRY